MNRWVYGIDNPYHHIAVCFAGVGVTLKHMPGDAEAVEVRWSFLVCEANLTLLSERKRSRAT